MKGKRCKYCDITANMDQTFITNVDYEFGKCLTAFEAIIVEDTIGPALGITVGEFVDECIPISYCPMCGRKLVE